MLGPKARILLVEDDPGIVTTLGELLGAEGYAMCHAATQREAVDLLGQQAFDLALVDVTLAEGNGFAVCRAAKDLSPQTAVVFVTASDDELNTVCGLSLGADDYIAKPFRPRELLARIEAVLRRTHHVARSLGLGSLEIDLERGRVVLEGRELALSAVEYRLLLLFATHAGGIVTRDAMRETLWENAGSYIEDNTLSVYVKRLRERLAEGDPARTPRIETVRGMGYRLHE